MNQFMKQRDVICANAVADLIYVPFAFNQLETMKIVLQKFIDIYHQLKQPECMCSEALMTSIVHWTMLLANHTPIIPFPTKKENYDHRFEILYPNKDHSNYYKILLEFMNNYAEEQQLSLQEFRIRPVPLAWAGYEWNRGMNDYMEWLVLRENQHPHDPPFAHPIKAEQPNSRPSAVWQAGHERQLQTLQLYKRQQLAQIQQQKQENKNP